MSKESTTLSKTCSICGKLKPLSAFIQYSGPEGSRFTSVCATCRSAGLDKQKTEVLDDSTSSTTGFKIDSKAKVQSEKDKRDFRQLKEEIDKEEFKKASEQRINTGVRKETAAKVEKTRRESFLDTQRKAATKAPTQPGDAMAEQATKEQKTDLSAPFVDTQIAKLKHQSSLLKQFKYGVLGGGTPLARSELKNTTEKEFIEKNFGPKGGRGR